MHICDNCGVALPDDPRFCPLCWQETREEGPAGACGEPVLPPLGTEASPSRTFLGIMAFASVAAGAVSVGINLVFPTGGWWCLFVLAGLASLWISFGVMLKKRQNLPKGILWQVSILSVLALLWDVFTGYQGWSVDYVLPILYTCAMIAMLVVAKIRRLNIQDYILYLLMSCVVGIVSLVLVVVGAAKVVIPSAVCFVCSVIFLSVLLFFEGRALRAELIRRFHL